MSLHSNPARKAGQLDKSSPGLILYAANSNTNPQTPEATNMHNEPVYLLTFGAGGHTLYGDHFTCTGYEDPDSFVKPYHWPYDAPGTTKTHFDYPIQPEGIPVIDLREAIKTKRGYMHVFNGPMPDVNLKDAEIEECPEPSPILAFGLQQQGGEYSQLLALHTVNKAANPKQAGPLDKVSIAEYVRGWKEHGARTGTLKVTNGTATITWNE